MVLDEDAVGLAGTGERERRRGRSISNFAVGDPRWRLCVATFEWVYMAGCELRGETSVGTGILAITASWYREGKRRGREQEQGTVEVGLLVGNARTRAKVPYKAGCVKGAMSGKSQRRTSAVGGE